MNIRMPGCRACAQITSGDCGMHGPVFIPGTSYQQMPTFVTEPFSMPKSQPSAALVDREALQSLIATWTKRAADYAFYGQPFHPRADAIRECAKELEALLSPRTDTPTGEPKP